MNTAESNGGHIHLSRTEKQVLGIIIVLVLGLVLTVLALLNNSVTTAWVAGAVTVGGLAALWPR